MSSRKGFQGRWQRLWPFRRVPTLTKPWRATSYFRELRHGNAQAFMDWNAWACSSSSLQKCTCLSAQNVSPDLSMLPGITLQAHCKAPTLGVQPSQAGGQEARGFCPHCNTRIAWPGQVSPLLNASAALSGGTDVSTVETFLLLS